MNLDPLFEGQDVVALARATFERIGLDVAGILDRSDLHPRAGKCQHAFCIDVDRSGDVRVLANVVDNHSWTETMLHELGHGVYDLGYGGSLPWLLRDTHLVTTEATALLFGALGGDREWLERVRGIDAGEAESLERELRAAKVAAPRLHALGARHDRVRADPVRGSRRRPRHRVVGARRPPPAAHAAGGSEGAGLGGEDPHRRRAGLLPHVPVRLDRRAPAQGRAARRGRRDRRPPGGGELLAARLFAPGQSVRWDRLVEQAAGAPSPSTRSPARSQPSETSPRVHTPSSTGSKGAWRR